MPGDGTSVASPGAGPATTSRSAALSRTVRVRECVQPTGYANASSDGVLGTRPRDGLRPNRPHDAAGMRIEPPPSFPCAIGTMPDATAAAEPPLDPPADRARSCGIAGRAVEHAVRSSRSCPARACWSCRGRSRQRRGPGPPRGCRRRRRRRRPQAGPARRRATRRPRAPSAFTRYGTPANGPSPGGAGRLLARALSKRSATTACTSRIDGLDAGDGGVDRPRPRSRRPPDRRREAGAVELVVPAVSHAAPYRVAAAPRGPASGASRIVPSGG